MFRAKIMSNSCKFFNLTGRYGIYFKQSGSFYRKKNMILSKIMSKMKHFYRCSMLVLCLSAVFITLSEGESFAQSWKSYPYLKPGSKIEFPQDEGLHPEEDLEWWYANGHFTGQITGHHYSFMLAYFHRPASIFDGFRILTITDETTQESSSQVLPCVYPILAADSLHILTTFPTGNPSEEWVNQTDSLGRMLPFQYHIRASTGEDSIQLDMDALRPPLILDEDGFLYQGSENYTYYYSLTNLAVNGSVALKGVKEDINGIAWFDRQYGNFDPYEDESYEWFSIQLEDNMDLNIWNIFTPENSIPDSKQYRICSIIHNDTVSLTTRNFRIERLSFEYTPDSQRCYATSWRIISDTLKMNLLVEVNNVGSEINITEIALRFFEGSTKITGEINGSMVSGKGFAELLHSYEDPVIRMRQAVENDPWNEEYPLIWYVDNPDDGNPLKFDIEIEYESDLPVKVAGGMDDTIFYWNPSVFSTDTSFSIRVQAYSSDTTLQNHTTCRFLFVPDNTDFNACIGENFEINLNLDKSNLLFKWFYNGQITSFPETSILEISPVSDASAGVYRCLVYNEYFEDTTLEYHLGVGSCNRLSNHLMKDVIIYPNPFKEYLTFQLPVKTEKYLLRIRNLLGTVVYEGIPAGVADEAFYPKLKSGMYVIEVISQENHQIWSSKIVKR